MTSEVRICIIRGLSDPSGKVVHMFEGIAVGADEVADIGPAESALPDELLRHAERAVTGQSRLEWERYTAAAQLHRLLVESLADTPVAMRAVDPFSVCAAQLAAAQQMTQQGAEHHLTRALALRDRIPMVNQLLKEGLIAAHHIAAIISRTDLIEGSEFMADIDRDIAEALRRPGSWSKNRLRDMVDATIFRRDPNLVRENRDDATKRRGAPKRRGPRVTGGVQSTAGNSQVRVVEMHCRRAAV